MGSGSTPGTEVGFDDRQLVAELSRLRDPNSAENIQIQNLIKGQLDPSTANAFAMQQKAIGVGATGARQAASQAVREGAASRGLFSSDVALGAEGMALGGIEQGIATEQANLFGQQAGTIRSGILSGLQASGQQAQMRSSLAQAIAGGNLQAGQAQASLGMDLWKQQQQSSSSLAGTLGQVGAALAPMLPALLASDERLKENVADINGALEIIDDIFPVTFNWKETGDKDYGVIAQELEGVLPELVKEIDGIKRVNYNALFSILIKAVQELKEKIDA
jgi:hypothetical protein